MCATRPFASMSGWSCESVAFCVAIQRSFKRWGGTLATCQHYFRNRPGHGDVSDALIRCISRQMQWAREELSVLVRSLLHAFGTRASTHVGPCARDITLWSRMFVFVWMPQSTSFVRGSRALGARMRASCRRGQALCVATVGPYLCAVCIDLLTCRLTASRYSGIARYRDTGVPTLGPMPTCKDQGSRSCQGEGRSPCPSCSHRLL